MLANKLAHRNEAMKEGSSSAERIDVKFTKGSDGLGPGSPAHHGWPRANSYWPCFRCQALRMHVVKPNMLQLRSASVEGAPQRMQCPCFEDLAQVDCLAAACHLKLTQAHAQRKGMLQCLNCAVDAQSPGPSQWRIKSWW
jgi:hypothetical protein